MTASVLKAQLCQALEGWCIDPAEFADENRSLFSGGLLDSLALFNLSLWIEERVGQPIGPASTSVMTEWGSVASAGAGCIRDVGYRLRPKHRRAVTRRSQRSVRWALPPSVAT